MGVFSKIGVCFSERGVFFENGCLFFRKFFFENASFFRKWESSKIRVFSNMGGCFFKWEFFSKMVVCFSEMGVFFENWLFFWYIALNILNKT